MYFHDQCFKDVCELKVKKYSLQGSIHSPFDALLKLMKVFIF